jgi:predicted ribosomally synthesized peptide with nif11-like leader
MSEEQFKVFLEAIKGDPALQERLKAAEDLDAVVAIAKEAGFTISKAIVLKAQAQEALELSDEELEAVAGGGRIVQMTVDVLRPFASIFVCANRP